MFECRHLQVRRVGTAVWVETDRLKILVDAPIGVVRDLEAPVDRVVLCSGRLERVGGLLGVLDGMVEGALVAPLVDERGLAIVEAWQRAWSGRVVVDAVQPGESVEWGALVVETAVVSDPRGEAPAMGVRFCLDGDVVVVLPRCVVDGAVRGLCRGAALVVYESGAFEGGMERLIRYAGPADLWVDSTLVS